MVGTFGRMLSGRCIVHILNEKFDLDNKINEFLRKKFSRLCEKISRCIDHKKTKKIYSKTIKNKDRDEQ